MSQSFSAFFACAILFLAGLNGALAQTDISTTADVLQSLQVEATGDLDFGSVVAGTSVSVAPGDADAGSYAIQGDPGAEVTLGFALPMVLELITDPSITMPINFGAGDAVFNVASEPAGGTSFDPAVDQTANLEGSTGNLFVFVGGELTAGASQEPGSYEGTITLTVEYTGF
ncbi:DUF4402 domain-containing protein [Wenzhouxiangella sp. AB-CW3]|uniref:DUF4402 domain-containing protein n=1 Tax=Wenzhouxiangella sp. AB-CW3 TaxID=2771012 RepID=UPI00168BB687|nr:DUF4402 domain-containing protein [Wenzhouxiangella sp. AB-CW3]QOC23255.1 DUF4402 domain-containing protein [Wenzhouxiangella sp. AB-CW3]